MNIGDRVKECRIKLGYSAEQVAEKLGISPATEYRYENGDISKMPAKLVAPLAEFLLTTPAYLMGWPENDAQDPSSILKDDEKRLVTAYRGATKEIKSAALTMLENSAAENTPKKDSSADQMA